MHQTAIKSHSTHLPLNARILTAKKIHTATGPQALRATVALIGRAIRAGSQYVPLIQHTRRLASRAAPKDYLGQLQNIFDDVTKRWRYVHDPLSVELVSTSGPELYGQVLGMDYRSPDHGAGDCDDVAALLGAMAETVSLKSRIVTISPPRGPGSNKLFSHVYPEILIPKVGWIAADPVLYPSRPMGFKPPYLRKAVWDTYGRLIKASGYFPGQFKKDFEQMQAADIGALQGYELKKGDNMGSLHGYEFGDFQDLGLENFGYAGLGGEPEDWSTQGLLSFGAYMDRPLPMSDNSAIGFFAEYDENDFIGMHNGFPVVRTKMFEMDPREILHIHRTGRPRLGAVALGDDGDVYQWSEQPGLGGFFKKLFSRVKKGVKRVAKGIKKGVKAVARGAGKVVKGITKRAKKLIKKLPGGRYLVKVAGKVKSVAMRAVRPILKAGKFLSPIVSLVPGYGPVVAAALSQGPRILNIADKLGIPIGKDGKPKPQTKAQAVALKNEAEKQIKASRRALGRTREGRRIALPGTLRHKQLLRGYDLN